MKKTAFGSVITAIVITLGLGLVPGGLHAETDLTVQEIIRKVAPSVVTIEVYDKAGDLVSGGTGFVIGPGLVLTNAHVVDDAHSLSVSFLLPKKRTDRQPKRLKFDPDVDLALLEVRYQEPAPLSLDTSVQVEAGQKVVAYGNLYEEERLASEGIVRACLPGEIVSSAPTHGGHSGSPLLDMQGRVIGINARSIYEQGLRSMGIAISREAIAKFMKSPDKRVVYPFAGTSLFWPRTWKRIAGVFEAVFGWIFRLGEKLFSLYLKLAAVILAGLASVKIADFVKRTLKYRKAGAARESKPVRASLALAVWLISISFSALGGLYILSSLFSDGFDTGLLTDLAFFLGFLFISRVAWLYRRQHRPGAKGKTGLTRTRCLD